MTDTCPRPRGTPLLDLARSGAWLDSGRARDYGATLGLLYLATCLVALAWSGAAAAGATDFTSFYAAGRQALADPASVYDMAAHQAVERAVTGNQHLAYSYFFYPPVLLLLCAPLALLPYSVAYATWAALQLAAFVLALRRLAGPGATLLPYLAFPAGLMGLVMGQNALFTAALLAGGTAALAEGREGRGGALLGMVCYKPHFGLLLPVALAAGRHWRAMAAAAAAAMGLVAASALVFGPGTWVAWLNAFVQGTAAYGTTAAGGTPSGSSIPAWWLVSPFGAAVSLGLPRTAAMAVQGAATVAAAALVALGWWRREDAFAPKAMALLAGTMLAVPVTLYYDALPLAVGLAWAVRDSRRTGWLPWEKVFFLAAYVAALPAGLLRDLVRFPLLFPFSLGLMALAWRRARTPPPAAPQPGTPPAAGR